MKNRHKNLLILAVLVLLIGSVAYFGDFTTDEDSPSGNIVANGEMNEFVDCLDNNDVQIYGAEWCPFCTELAESFGGYDVVDPIYVECTEEQQRCEEEMIDTGVPEVQIDGEKYEGPRSPEIIGETVNCEL